MAEQKWWMEELPEIELGNAFARRLRVEPNGLGRMVGELTLPKPVARRGRQPVWFVGEIESWFAHLQPEQSAYAAVDDDLGERDLERGYYACPALDSRYIGNRRPVNLVIYHAGRERNANGFYEVSVFPVLWVQTEEGVMEEKIAVREGEDPRAVTPVDVRAGRDDACSLTTFVLDVTKKRVLELERGVQRGGTISTESLEVALRHGRAHHFQGGMVHLS